MLSGLQQSFDPALFGRGWRHNSPTGAPPRIRLYLGAHLAPVQIIGFLLEQRPTYPCLDNVEDTPGLVVDRCSAFRGLASGETMMVIWGQQQSILWKS